jgi:hypothetical protein
MSAFGGKADIIRAGGDLKNPVDQFSDVEVNRGNTVLIEVP